MIGIALFVAVITVSIDWFAEKRPWFLYALEIVGWTVVGIAAELALSRGATYKGRRY